MELAEVYKVIYDGPDDYLRGVIASADEESFFQYLFRDSGLDDDIRTLMMKYLHADEYLDADKKLDKSTKPWIKNRDHIMLNGPIKASIEAAGGIGVCFNLFGVLHSVLSYNAEPEEFSTPLQQVLMSDDGSRFVIVLFAMFKNAAEARLEIKLTSVSKSPLKLCGVIGARTSAISHLAYSSIVFCKERGDAVELAPGAEVSLPLSRPLVVVPLGSKLVLDFGLRGDDNERIVEDRLCFDATKDGLNPAISPIKCSKVEFEVKVNWRYARRPMEPPEIC